MKKMEKNNEKGELLTPRKIRKIRKSGKTRSKKENKKKKLEREDLL